MRHCWHAMIKLGRSITSIMCQERAASRLSREAECIRRKPLQLDVFPDIDLRYVGSENRIRNEGLEAGATVSTQLGGKMNQQSSYLRIIARLCEPCLQRQGLQPGFEQRHASQQRHTHTHTSRTQDYYDSLNSAATAATKQTISQNPLFPQFLLVDPWY